MFLHTSAGSTDGISVTTPALNITGANGIYIFLNTYPVTVANLTDTASNSWVGKNFASADLGPSIISTYFFPNPTTSTTYQVTYTGSAGNKPAIAVIAFDGMTGYDGDNHADSASAVTSIQPNSITPTNNNELVLTGIGATAAISGIGIDSGFTVLAADIITASANTYGIAVAYLLQGAKVAVNPLWSWTTSAQVPTTIAAIQGTFTIPAGAACTPGSLAMMGVGCGIALARKLEENPVVTRRGLLLPRRRSLLIGHNGGPPLDE